MKNNGVENLKVLGASLCLSAVLLTGCGETRISVGNSNIVVEEEKTTGTISYEDLSNHVKLVIFKEGESSVARLLVRKEDNGYVRYSGSYTHIQYSDLKTGITFIEYLDYNNKDIDKKWYVGESLTIIREENITSYLLLEDFIKKDYTVEELLTFLEEKVLPTLNSDNKELVK